MAKSRRSGQAADTLVPATLGWYRLRPTDRTVQYWNGSALTDVMPDFGKSYPTLVMQNGIVFQSSAPASAPKRVSEEKKSSSTLGTVAKVLGGIVAGVIVIPFAIAFVGAAFAGISSGARGDINDVADEPAISEPLPEPAPEAPVIEAPPPPPVVVAPPPPPPPAPVDYGTCANANDNGFGDYRAGVHPEYEFYDDRDKDGIVCERA